MSTEYGARARPFYEDLIVRNPDGSTEGRDPRKLPKSLLKKAYPQRTSRKGNPASLSNASPDARNLDRPAEGHTVSSQHDSTEKSSVGAGNSVGSAIDRADAAGTSDLVTGGIADKSENLR